MTGLIDSKQLTGERPDRRHVLGDFKTWIPDVVAHVSFLLFFIFATSKKITVLHHPPVCVFPGLENDDEIGQPRGGRIIALAEKQSNPAPYPVSHPVFPPSALVSQQSALELE